MTRGEETEVEERVKCEENGKGEREIGQKSSEEDRREREEKLWEEKLRRGMEMKGKGKRRKENRKNGRESGRLCLDPSFYFCSFGLTFLNSCSFSFIFTPIPLLIQFFLSLPLFLPFISSPHPYTPQPYPSLLHQTFPSFLPSLFLISSIYFIILLFVLFHYPCSIFYFFTLYIFLFLFILFILFFPDSLLTFVPLYYFILLFIHLFLPFPLFFPLSQHNTLTQYPLPSATALANPLTPNLTHFSSFPLYLIQRDTHILSPFLILSSFISYATPIPAVALVQNKTRRGGGGRGKGQNLSGPSFRSQSSLVFPSLPLVPSPLSLSLCSSLRRLSLSLPPFSLPPVSLSSPIPLTYINVYIVESP